MKIFLLIFVFNITVVYSESPRIGFIYVNANSGQSSGGHSAFLIGETVYHFQLFSDGIFHLVREPFESFRTVYGEIENRSIWIHILDLDQKKAEQVREFWNLAYIEQQVELRELENLENYLFLLNQIIANRNFASNSIALNLQSLGYFSSESPNKQTYQFIQKSFSKLELEKKLKDWKNFITNNHLNSLEKSKLLLNSIYHIHALENIMNRNGLQEESYFEIPSFMFQFDISLYFRRLKEYQFILEQNILDILKSPSLWNGRALVMSLARWCVIQRSIQEKKFYFLDSFSDTYSYLPYKKLISSKTFHIMENQFLELFQKEVKNFIIQKANSQRYTLLEDRANRLHAFYSSLETKSDLKLTFEILIPSKTGRFLFSHNVDLNILQENSKKMNSTHEEYKKFLQAKYPFELISKNCTTEIFSLLNKIVENSPEKAKNFYGGYIDTKNNLNFIPFIAFDSVKQKYLTRATLSYPSLRIRYLQKLTEQGYWKKMILESNTLTSELYEINEEDGWFLFFTDDIVFLRPIYGIFNLSAGILETGFGIFKLPFDKGKKLKTGTMNTTFSFVEILFFNVRKGNFPATPTTTTRTSENSETEE